MNQFLKRRLLNEAMLTFIKACFLLLLISSEPFGEIAAMIDLLKKFTQLLMNDFALIDYCGEYGGCEKEIRRSDLPESSHDVGERAIRRASIYEWRSAGFAFPR